MSIDFKIQNICDHYINWERRYIEEDLRTINLGRLVASEKSFVLRINGSVIPTNSYTFSVKNVNLTLEKNTSIVLTKKIKFLRPLIEVRYTTILRQCPKCRRSKILDDITYSNRGDVTTVGTELQLIQTVEKYIITRINSSIFHPWFGTSLHMLMGNKIGNFELTKSQIIEQVSSAISNLKDIQRQLVGSGRKVDPGELFGKLLSISVDRDTQDPTIVHVLLRFTSQSGKQLEYEQLLEFSQLRERLV